MDITLFTEGWFDAAHNLEGYDGACANLHGHTYKIELWVRGTEKQINKIGLLWDFKNLKNILNKFDHKYLNEIFNKEENVNSTAENQVLWIYRELKGWHPRLKFKVRLYEQVQPKRSFAQVGDFE